MEKSEFVALRNVPHLQKSKVKVGAKLSLHVTFMANSAFIAILRRISYCTSP